jgi:hypothetical protein
MQDAPLCAEMHVLMFITPSLSLFSVFVRFTMTMIDDEEHETQHVEAVLPRTNESVDPACVPASEDLFWCYPCSSMVE